MRWIPFHKILFKTNKEADMPQENNINPENENVEAQELETEMTDIEELHNKFDLVAERRKFLIEQFHKFRSQKNNDKCFETLYELNDLIREEWKIRELISDIYRQE